jgi:hypothetical protein
MEYLHMDKDNAGRAYDRLRPHALPFGILHQIALINAPT